MPDRPNLPDQDQLRTGIALIESYLQHMNRVDRVLFRRFSREETGIVQTKLRALLNNPAASVMSDDDWNYTSQLLRTMSLSFSPFPDFAGHPDPAGVYAAIDAIDDYAYGGNVMPAVVSKGRSHGP